MNKVKLKWWLIKHNFFKYTFHVAGFVYVDKKDNVTNELTDKIKWLGDVEVYCFYKDMNKFALEKFNRRYPQYLGHINVY